MASASAQAAVVLANGFGRFYKREVLALFENAGALPYLALVDLGRDFIAIYDAGASRQGGRRA